MNHHNHDKDDDGFWGCILAAVLGLFLLGYAAGWGARFL